MNGEAGMSVISVTSHTVEQLRIKIITGELESGQRLNETQLAKGLGISTPPLREAFRILENTQLVKSIPRKGTFVTKISEKYLEEIYAARRMIECFAVELLHEQNNRNPKGVKETLITTPRILKMSTDDNEKIFEFWRTLSGFHVRLVESCENSTLIEFYRIISDHLARIQFLYLKNPGAVKKSIGDHRQILTLIENGKHGQAREVLKNHLDKTFFVAHEAVLKDMQAIG